ncbi:MAG: hypothetical protein O7G30_11830 [Proteobacteria bacterium]|nr:hypothetical protein [Pseudomonadota bacterium]
MSVSPAVGVDMGATLAKIAIRENGGADVLRFERLPAYARDRVASRIEALRPASIGLTGCGAAELADRLSCDTAAVNEFAAWGAGASRLLRDNGLDDGERYLLVSLGTGTSVLLVDGMSVNRTGGTALGGGTVVGLGAALLGTRDFAEISALAEKGERGRVDLLVRDIYRPGGIALMGDLTASAFGKLARPESGAASREDLAAAIMGLVGENVALVCGGLAAAAQVRRVVLGGSTLHGNPVLTGILTTVIGQLGRQATLLPEGEFAGALGGLELARAR